MDKFNITEKEILNDILISQNFITDKYNISINECIKYQLRTDLINILREEHSIQYAISEQIIKRSLKIPEYTDKSKITESYKKYKISI